MGIPVQSSPLTRPGSCASRFLPEVMLTVVLVLIVFVQAVGSFGDWLVRRLSHE